MAAVAPLHIQGIEKAFERVILSGAGAEPRPLVAEKLRVRDAAHLLKMMEVAADAAAAEGREVWVLQNINQVRAMANAAEILKLVEVLILPELRQHPTRNGLLNALNLFAGSLREEAAAAGGSCQVVMAAAASSMGNYVAEARAQPATPYDKLRQSIEELIRHFRSERSYTIRTPAAAPAAPAN